jgi:hypothetical protein
VQKRKRERDGVASADDTRATGLADQSNAADEMTVDAPANIGKVQEKKVRRQARARPGQASGAHHCRLP